MDLDKHKPTEILSRPLLQCLYNELKALDIHLQKNIKHANAQLFLKFKYVVQHALVELVLVYISYCFIYPLSYTDISIFLLTLYQQQSH